MVLCDGLELLLEVYSCLGSTTTLTRIKQLLKMNERLNTTVWQLQNLTFYSSNNKEAGKQADLLAFAAQSVFTLGSWIFQQG